MLKVQFPAHPAGSAKAGSGGGGAITSPAVCTHEAGLAALKSTLWDEVPAPTGKLKSTVAPTGTVTLLSAGSLLAASWNQLRVGFVASCATIAARPGVAVGDGDGDGDGLGEGEGEGDGDGDWLGDGVGDGATTVTDPRMFQSSPEWYS